MFCPYKHNCLYMLTSQETFSLLLRTPMNDKVRVAVTRLAGEDPAIVIMEDPNEGERTRREHISQTGNRLNHLADVIPALRAGVFP